MTGRTRAAWLLGTGCILLAGALFNPRAAAEVQGPKVEGVCTQPLVQVKATNLEDVQDICRGVQDATSFLAGHGFLFDQPLVIEVADKLPEDAGPFALGCFFTHQSRIVVLSYAAFKEIRNWLNVPVSRELYRSLAAHETAHAWAESNISGPNQNLVAQEYIAYVVMFVTMNPDLRTSVLHAVPGFGFDDELQINAMVYMLDPVVFAVESYRHYLKPGNGPAFLQKVLTGKALAE
ncbi:MAG: DUF6639 family protein [Meiothermus sp.]|nr:DUF6639 family protein [Meiothermus sp.]